MNNLEFLYRLSLPCLADVLCSKDILKSYTEKLSGGSRIFYPDPNELFKKEWLGYKGLQWDYVSVFVRTGSITGMIHRDNPNNTHLLHWGINWVVGDDGYMDYWIPEQISEERIVSDLGGGETVTLYTEEPPFKQYKTDTGVYLINASVPHRARNLSTDVRISLSLRSKKFRYENPNLSWKDIINKFQDVILV